PHRPEGAPAIGPGPPLHATGSPDGLSGSVCQSLGQTAAGCSGAAAPASAPNSPSLVVANAYAGGKSGRAWAKRWAKRAAAAALMMSPGRKGKAPAARAAPAGRSATTASQG